MLYKRCLTEIALLLGLFTTVFSFSAYGADGDMEIGLLYRYQTYAMDVSELNPGHSFGFVFRYWLNDTSTIDVELHQSISTWDIETARDSEELTLERNIIYAGLVYLPKLDFVARPALGIGAGYQQWSAESDVTNGREGQGYTVYASAALEFVLWEFVTISPTARFVYFPFEENFVNKVIEEEVNNTTIKRKEKTDFEHAGVIEVGVNFTFNLR